MDNAQLTDMERLGLRTFDMFCSAGRPQRPTVDIPGPELVEVSCQELFGAFLIAHPAFNACKAEVLLRLPERMRIHAEWWQRILRGSVASG
jgi:hypothetical protein